MFVTYTVDEPLNGGGSYTGWVHIRISILVGKWMGLCRGERLNTGGRAFMVCVLRSFVSIERSRQDRCVALCFLESLFCCVVTLHHDVLCCVVMHCAMLCTFVVRLVMLCMVC